MVLGPPLSHVHCVCGRCACVKVRRSVCVYVEGMHVWKYVEECMLCMCNVYICM